MRRPGRRFPARTLLLAAVIVSLFVGGAPAAAVPGAPSGELAQLPPLPVEGLFTGSPPEVTAQTWILYDATFDQILGEQGADEQRPMASTTKMMTALLVARETSPFESVVISETAPQAGEAEVDLQEGEIWTVGELQNAILLESANDAALALAEHVGGTVDGFVKLMNDEAALLGLSDTSFANPHGLDEEGHYSSARDLLALARTLMAVDELATIVGSREIPLPDTPEGEERIARNTNRLLFEYPGANGVKTGYTDDAGWTLVASAERDDRLLYVVVMGAPTVDDRFADAAALLDYGFGEFGVVEIIVAGVDYARRRLPGEAEEVVATESFSIFSNREDAEQIELTPTFTGDTAVVVASIAGEELGRVPLEIAPKAALPDLGGAVAWASRYWDWLFGNE
jgi:D-alanyl-D-alanine carboxypeptidase